MPAPSCHSLRLLLALAAITAVLPVRAQNDPGSQAAAIEAIYPVMIAALEAKQFGRARNICDQVILWEPQNPVHHYNLACIEAQAGGARLPYAFGALELAVVLGFSDAAHMQADPDLVPLRAEPRFAELLRRVAHNANAGDAISALMIPPAPEKAPAAPPAGPPAERPAPPTFHEGVPAGLYWMNRYKSAAHPPEQAAWYFAPDGTVYRDLAYGWSGEDLAGHGGPRGRATTDGRTLSVHWSDGTTSAGPVERDSTSFSWDMAIFTAVESFGDAGEVPGVYVGGGPLAGEESVSIVPRRLTLRPDGTFVWEGVSILAAEGAPTARIASSTASTAGRWELNGYSITLTAEPGIKLRRIAFPDDDDRTVVRPDRMFFGGLMLKRQP